MTRRIGPRQSLGFARQAAFGTENTTDGDFTYFEAEMSAPVDLVRNIQDYSPSKSQVGANAPRLAGSKHGGTFTLKYPMRALIKTYDGGAGGGGVAVLGTTDGQISMEFLLLGNAWGSAGSGSVAAATDFTKGKHLSVSAGIQNDVTGGTAATAEVADATVYKEGQMWVSMAGTQDDNPAVAWIKTATAGTTVTFTESVEAAEAPAATDDSFDTAVAYVSEGDRVPLTFRVLGNNAGFKGAYIGCTATETRIALGAGDLWWTEIDFMYTNRTDYAAGGGLQEPDDFFISPALLGDDGGRMIYGAAGTATEVNSLGFKDMELKVSWPTHDIMDINASQGVGEILNVLPEITLTAKIPLAHNDPITNGEDPYETILTTEARRSFQFSSGQEAGEMTSLYLGGMQLKEMPKRVWDEDVEYYDCMWEAGELDNETGTDAPANNLCRLGVA